MATIVFAGGNSTQNSGGIGPDRYLFRLLPKGKWVEVYWRVTRLDSKEAYQADKAALIFLLKHRPEVNRTAHGDNRKRLYNRRIANNPIPLMSMAEYLDSLGIEIDWR